jgi:gamma-glutamyl hercynylcysteine S-oxide synthase
LIRQASRDALGLAMQGIHANTDAMVARWREVLGDTLAIPYEAVLNPMGWEVGHVAWFESWWLARNERARPDGERADPHAQRVPPKHVAADAWYDSSRVAHADRWTLPLPTIAQTVDTVHRGREVTRQLLAANPEDDRSLYFFRLSALHECMHQESWSMMAQHLGLPISPPTTVTAPPTNHASGLLAVNASLIDLGREAWQAGFAFDNEYGQRTERLDAFDIDTHAVTWGRYLPFVEAGGYAQKRWWTEDGWAWCQQQRRSQPKHVRRTADGRWERQAFGVWHDLDVSQAACHLTLHEAQAWCAFAGRRLPSEAQWRAAHAASTHFAWGQVWEWTSSVFQPFAGFEPHPYRDYSKPWFGTHQVLKGASAWTHPQMVHPHYRNFFLPTRDDVLAGFRSVLPRPS